MSEPPRVLLLWPGTHGTAAGNFGCPALVTMATYARERTGAQVTVIDLAAEQALGPLDLPKLLGEGRYDVVGVSCYSSYDFIKSELLASMIREALPKAVIVAGGYHVSARPAEMLAAGFDVAVVGEGEKPLAALCERVALGDRPHGEILGPDPITDLDELPVTDFSLLDRYRPVFDRVAPQLMVYLSRGCPYDCAFCMEQAKRETSWRPYSVPRALAEIESLARLLPLERRTVYFADALFGMKRTWRREFLRRFADSGLRAHKYWLLIRVDMVEDLDLELFAEANCALGFGLESGDPAQLKRIRKAGKLDTYLERMKHIASKSRELDLPWGANVIVGHPGETRESLGRSAEFLRDLFSGPPSPGFLSVDPFRLYPGSPIDDDRAHWEREYGTRFHRPSWWHDGDQEFLSEWVDPSADLTYRQRATLMQDLLAPVLSGICESRRYEGPAQTYFAQAAEEQVELCAADRRLHFIARHYAWLRYLGKKLQAERLLADDEEARELLLQARAQTVAVVADRLREPGADGPSNPALFGALVRVPRERYVPADKLLESTRDEVIGQDDTVDGEHRSTVSALHAYAIAFALLGVEPGMRVLDLGCGSGYGSALLAELVGSHGQVIAVEVSSKHSELAQRLRPAQVDVRCANALHPDLFSALATEPRFDRIYAGFALPDLATAQAMLSLLAEDGRAVMPVTEPDDQQGLYLLRPNDPPKRIRSVYYVTAQQPPAPEAQPAEPT